MRRVLPPITEDAETLKHLLQRERDGRKKPRLQMLYLLASGQASERQEVARLLGIHRNTIGRWLALYQTGGLDALLAIYVPAGKLHSVPCDIQTSIGKALAQPQGFASYQALRQWVKHTHQRDITYHTLYRLVRTKFKAKLKVPRPSHTKKP